MPEIKHQFTGGKMNKDLDERLVPNGEYRDALNIQVSTSEASDVGTVQNILGNSLIPGQDFIGQNSVCIGSIADEKNDKLYYFITNNEELIVNGEFNDGSSDWTLGTGWTYANGKIEGNSVALYNKINQPNLPTNKFIVGREYEISFTVSAYTAGNINVILYNENGDGFAIPSFTPEDKTYTFTKEVGTHNTTDTDFYSRFYIQRDGNSGFTGDIDNISIKPTNSAIIEYDANTNSITPVLVDTVGDVLKFNPDNIITGINIIDDLLFWTDNENEPKKINIKRSIEGTDASGTVHTDFINDKRTDLFGLIKEEHITVIKKAPKLAPTIELISERFDYDAGIYTGVTRITSSVPTAKNAANTNNTSSLWTNANSQFNHHYDFSNLVVGSYFDIQIETDVNGDSGFNLNWQLYDTLLFKEFTGPDFEELPKIPVVDYSIKAKIVIWDVADGGPNIFTDTDSEMVQNEDFIIPDANGNAPKYYSGLPGDGWTYDNAGNYILGDDVTNYDRVSSSPTIPFVIGDTYTVSFTISNFSPTVPMDGKILIKIVGPTPVGGGDPPHWDTTYVSTVGTHTFTIDTNATPTGYNYSWLNDKWFFQASDIGGVGFTGRIENVSIIKVNTENARVRCKVLAINNPPVVPSTESELRFVVDKQNEEEKLFEFKFPRFAYRYQYEDREYSTISPFSQIAFMPGLFDYHPKKGYNLGMTNRINEIGIKDFVIDVPDGVVAIDILYKDDSSPNIYVLDTIKQKHNPYQDAGNNIWDENAFIVTSEQVSQMLPSNQLLRLWDNVPKKALAQDISGNRIIYGNYVQGFDLKASSGEDYYALFDLNWAHNPNTDLTPKKSIKSLREYQLGVVFVDEYGRETPVISNKSGTKKLNKKEADKQNVLEIDFQNQKFPENMKYFKFFIKETSGEYYNLAMDRFYDAEDGQTWLSFPSSDRNKIDIDTFLILKKGVESNEIVSAEAKYKVLDIQNEAPDFIKQDKRLIEKRTHVAASTDIFGSGLTDAPLNGNDTFKMNYSEFHGSSGSNLHEIKNSDLYIEFTDATDYRSERYRVSEISTDYADGSDEVDMSAAKYSIKLEKQFGDDVDFIAQGGGQNPTSIKNGTIVNIYKYTIENSPKFDGRFFVKINTDSTFNENISIASNTETDYRTVLSKKLYYLSSQTKNLHDHVLTGQDKGAYSIWDFHAFAPFFRNYNKPADELTYEGEQVGQYQFGDAGNDDKRKWLQELTWITTAGTASPDSLNRNNTSGNSNTWPGVKIADDHGWSTTDRDGVFNDNEEQTDGEVWFIDGGPYVAKRWDDDLWWPGVVAQPGTGLGISALPGSSSALIEIGIGGIHSNKVQYGTGSIGGDAEYFNVGNGASGNAKYGGGNENLVSKFYSGQKFRFREDPSGEVYTMQSSITDYNRLRWQDLDPNQPGWGSDAPSGEANHGQRSFDYKTQDMPGHVPNTWFNDGSGLPGNNSSYSDFKVFAKQLSPNFTKTWRPRFVNSRGNGNVDWDPTGDPGPIVGGLELAINHHSTLQWDYVTPQPYAVVDSLLATDANGLGIHSITTGMILTSHSDGAAADTYDGTTDAKAPLAIKSIEDTSGNGAGPFNLFLSGYSKFLTATPITSVAPRHNIFDGRPDEGEEMIFEQPKMNGYSQYSVNRINAQWGDDSDHWGIMAIGYNLEFIEAIETDTILPDNPAIWETEPKESTDLDIYYEASGLNPLELDSDTANMFIPSGSTVEDYHNNGYIEAGTTVMSFTNVGGNWEIKFDKSQLVGGVYFAVGDHIKITKPNGDVIIVKISGWNSLNVSVDGRIDTFQIYDSLYGGQTRYALNWHNCYSFGNGVESNRIRDNFNLPYMSNGVKVSTTLDEGHGEEHRASGLIYSGIYNSNSSTNNLNQFIAAEKITKDINPIYGSIQKLHSRDSDLVTLCEDKCLRILVQKDALYNADGSAQLLAREGVLGQTIPFSGEFGISKNPESFASESYRVYFTDKVRGTVMRLSKDGLTPISNHGMKDWFKDNLKLSTKLIGSYDDRKDEYNITLNATVDEPILGQTVSFKEDVRGWVSLKSFVPENGVSMASDYYTMLGGKLYQHHIENTNRNHFYGVDYNSSVNVILNDGPGSIKSFHTLAYEGSQSKIDEFSTDAITGLSDAQPYNLTSKDGWYVSNIETDKQEGNIHEFIEKEGKWFNYIKGVDSDISAETDFGAFDIQGIGILSSISSDVLTFSSNINTSLQIGDIIYSQTPSTNGLFSTIDSSNITKYGDVTALTTTTITVNLTDTAPLSDDYIMFAKNHTVNTSSLLGYFADVKLENNSTDKIELFSVGSEITESSK